VGAFVIPSVVSADLTARWGVRAIGTVPGIRERFYAISAERRLENPPVVAISDAARSNLFA